jgi:hypothetical protein
MSLLKWEASSSDALTPGDMSTWNANSKWLKRLGALRSVWSTAPFWIALGWGGRAIPGHPGWRGLRL